jgi:asparagine synthase (glutamine-hydrolysing)
MCGIAGRLNFKTDAPVERHVLTGMCDLLAHRGPDGAGAYVDGALGLGHRRLAVIDTSDAGRQPMTDGEGLWITFNGEIYNFLQLKSELEGRGHRFHTATDTEVILAAHRQWGVEALSRLRGMFALAIWNARDRSLLLARDRVGKKPLYYRLDRDGLAFASEPKAFLAEPSFVPEPHRPALLHYLSLQYVPAPLSAFAGVERLEPGHQLVVRDGGVSTERYWTLRYAPKVAMDEREALGELRRRLAEAVRLRLISDVPLGAFLSGGIDSSVVVALMAEAAGARVKTFSIGFHEARYNELPHARAVADRFATHHHEYVVTPDAVALLPKLVWHYNEPYADSSAVPTFYLAEVTRRTVTVALTGDAGDENFAGYDRYRANVLAARLDRLPMPLRALAGAAARRLPAPAGWPRVRRLRRFLEAVPLTRERRYATWMLHFDAAQKRALCTPDFLAAAGTDSEALIERWFHESDAADFVDATLDADVHTYLPDDLLVKVDIATMAHGLEARSPFLDHELMEFAASLPVGLKLHGRTQKYLLRQLARPLVPASVIDRPKQGFGVPIDVWFRRELRDLAHDVLLGRSARQRGYFRHEVVERLLAEHVAGTRAWHAQLWNLLMFELWHQTFVDRRPEAPAAAS